MGPTVSTPQSCYRVWLLEKKDVGLRVSCCCLRNAEKPDKEFEDPQDVLEIQEAKDNIGDVVMVKQPTVHAQGKKKGWTALEEKVPTLTVISVHSSPLFQLVIRTQ